MSIIGYDALPACGVDQRWKRLAKCSPFLGEKLHSFQSATRRRRDGERHEHRHVPSFLIRLGLGYGFGIVHPLDCHWPSPSSTRPHSKHAHRSSRLRSRISDPRHARCGDGDVGLSVCGSGLVLSLLSCLISCLLLLLPGCLPPICTRVDRSPATRARLGGFRTPCGAGGGKRT